MATKCQEILVMYASQTGNAEFIAKVPSTKRHLKGLCKHIAHLSSQAHFKSECHAMDDYEKVNLGKNNLLVFVTSSTGDGDPPDNSTKFWRWLKKAKAEELAVFKSKKIALMGLGDTNYTNFNQPAKRLDKKLTDLGCVHIINRVLVDDATGLEAGADPWIDNLLKILPEHVEHTKATLNNCSTAFPTATSKEPSNESLITIITNISSISHTASIDTMATRLNDFSMSRGEISYKISLSDEEVAGATELTGLAKSTPAFLNVVETTVKKTTSTDNPFLGRFQGTFNSQTCNASHPVSVPITLVSCLTGSKALERVIELTISIKSLEGWAFIPGDAIGVVCPNPDTIVLPLLRRLSLEPNLIFTMDSTDGSKGDNMPFDDTKSLSFYEALRWITDLHNFPKKAFFRTMSDYTADSTDKRKLLFLSSTQGTKALKRIRDEKPTILDILESFPSVNIPFSRLLELLQKLQPRFYSISSSPISNPNEIKIAFNVINYELCGRMIHGLCSTWLDRLTGCVKEGNASVSINIPIFPKPRSDMIITVPESLSVPIIMICAGTGVTPFMGLIEHIGQKYARFNVRTMTKSITIDTADLPETWLFYGCRFAGPNGDILYRDEFQTAQESGILSKFDLSFSREIPKEYVQDKIKAHGKEILSWVMEKGAIIYVCGSLAMSKDVHACLVSLFEQNGADGTTQLLSLMSNKRYIKEIWG